MSLVFYALSFFLWDLRIHYDSTTGYKLMNIASLLLASIYVSVFMFSTDKFKFKLFRFRNKLDVYSYRDYMDFKINKYAKTFFT